MTEHKQYRKGFLITGNLIGLVFFFIAFYTNLVDIKTSNLFFAGLYFFTIILIWKIWPLPYILSSFDELLDKVTWPTWEELQNSAVVVAIASLIIALIIFVMDQIFSKLMEVFYNLF